MPSNKYFDQNHCHCHWLNLSHALCRISFSYDFHKNISLNVTHPNVSSSLCTDQICFVKYEVCMVEDYHGELATGVGVVSAGAGDLIMTRSPPDSSSPDSSILCTASSHDSVSLTS